MTIAACASEHADFGHRVDTRQQMLNLDAALQPRAVSSSIISTKPIINPAVAKLS
ncbi:MAG: hypothetical protein H0T88_03045 [Lysobacter sp.]|nr:hypothetical protein [Lysobacter sp.]MDQ3512007.1 hypothetical protein [Pseudomonadota bacterium]